MKHEFRIIWNSETGKYTVYIPDYLNREFSDSSHNIIFPDDGSFRGTIDGSESKNNEKDEWTISKLCIRMDRQFTW